MILTRLLRRNINLWQIAGYAVASFIGLTIIMVSVLFYGDLQAAMGGESLSDSFRMLSEKNIVISKPVGLSSTLSGQAPVFSESEIKDLEKQPWVKDIAPFTAADFSVWASAEFSGRGFQTAMFFESVPDRVMDSLIVAMPQWQFDPQNPLIPIVIPKDYLSLYNYGFAASGHMPVVSESIVSNVPLKIVLGGRGKYHQFSGRIIGYSNDLNTIAVPESFMQWAHEHYGSGEAQNPSRLIITATDPASPQIAKYLEHNGYEAPSHNSKQAQAAFIAKTVASVAISIGVIISLLACAIMVLSLFLLITKNRSTISELLLLGYKPGAIAGRYIKIVGGVNAGVLILAVGATLWASTLWRSLLTQTSSATCSLWPTIVTGAAISLAIFLLNFLAINRLVRKSASA